MKGTSWWKRNISKPTTMFFKNSLNGAQNRTNELSSKVGSIINISPFETDSKGRLVTNRGFTAETAIKVAGTYSAVLYTGLDETDPSGVVSASRLAPSQLSNVPTQDYYNTINNLTYGDAGIKSDVVSSVLLFVPGEGQAAKGGYTVTSIAVRTALANRVGKRGFTKVGYAGRALNGALWKTAMPPGTKNPAAFNEAGYKIFKEIWKAPGSFKKVDGFLEKQLPDRRGIRLQENWEFKGFID